MPKFLNSVDITAPSLKIESPGTLEPVLEILSTGDNLVSGVLKFHKQRADNSPENDDVMGVIHFHGEDAGGLEQLYGAIKCTVSEVTDGAEGGKLFLSVASHDGEDQPGLLISDGDAEDEVDVTIANGIASVTTIAGTFTCGSRTFAAVGGTAGAHDGDVVYFGNTTGLTTGLIYVYTAASNAWVATNADHIDTSDGLLGVALGAESDTNGMLLRGVVSISHDPGAKADILYLQSDNAGDVGKATATAPSADGDCVRIIGYQIDADDEIWFNPDNTFIEVTA